MIDVAVILAGGLATRLRPITEKIPKSLVEVAGKPFITWQLELLKSNGFKRIILCVGHLGEQIEAVVGNGASWGLEVEYSFDGPTLKGTGGALAQAAGKLDKLFWVLYGDSYLDIDYQEIARFYELQAASPKGAALLGLMTVFRNQNQWDTSNVIFVDGELIKYDKFNRTAEMHYIDYGAAILNKKVFDRFPDYNQPVDLSEIYTRLVDDKLMLGYEVTRRFYEIGSHNGLQETAAFLAGKGFER